MRRANRRHQVPQLDLFRSELAQVEWRQLPLEVRGKARELMARMLRESRAPGAEIEPAGGRDE
jgi:hypothetical protein